MQSAAPPGISPDDCVLLFDGVCNLCNGAVQFFLKRDPTGRIRFASLQSSAGQALLAWRGLPLEHFDTIVFIERGQAYFKSTAVLRAARYLRWPWPAAAAALVVPRFVRDWCYDRVAQNRYRLFGKREECMIPTPELKARFLD